MMKKIKRLAIVFISFSLIFMVTFCGKSEPSKGEKKEKKAEDKSPEKEKKDKDKKKETDAVPVAVVNPHYGDISSFLLFSSNVEAEKSVDIYPMTQGILEKLLHDEGDHVKKGD